METFESHSVNFCYSFVILTVQMYILVPLPSLYPSFHFLYLPSVPRVTLSYISKLEATHRHSANIFEPLQFCSEVDSNVENQ